MSRSTSISDRTAAERVLRALSAEAIASDFAALSVRHVTRALELFAVHAFSHPVFFDAAADYLVSATQITSHDLGDAFASLARIGHFHAGLLNALHASSNAATLDQQ